jgi:PAS domain S-box-containing protein
MAILIVDDHEQNNYMLEVLLKGAGYSTRQVTNGQEALEELKHNNIDLIISDILMPVMDGFELCRRIKANKKFCKIPVIFYTATYTGTQDENFAIKIGAARFIEKPCEPEILLKAINEVFNSGIHENKDPIKPAEEEVLKLYNERLVRKLEQKMLELEKETKELRKTQNSLDASEYKYKRLLQGMTDGFVCVDLKKRIIEVNDSYCEMLGYTGEELVGMSYEDFTPPEWHELEQKISDQVMQKDSSGVYEKEYIKKDGTVFPIELRTSLVFDDQNNKVGMWAIVRDITERKAAEKKEKELEQQLFQAQKMETIGRLAGGIAHDFNNLLSVIIGYSSLILEMLDEEAPYFNKLNEVYQAGMRAKTLTRQLLAFSRKQQLETEILNLNQIIGNFEKLMRRLIGDNIDLKLNLLNKPLRIKADAAQIEQVLMNLAVNARDAMPKGGSITLTTKETTLDNEQTEIYSELKPGKYSIIEFKDTGTGINSELIDKIYEPFFTTKEKDKGTGLGLSTCYGIIKQHHGDIRVESREGHGTTFTILIPVCDAKPVRLKNDTTPVSSEPRKGKVLVIEDDPHVRKLTCMVFSDKGYEVLESKNGIEAIKMAQKITERIDIIVSDVIMPEMKGPEACRQIKQIHPEAKILFISGHADNQLQDAGFNRFQAKFIQKPFSIRELLKQCDDLLKED